MKNPKTPVARTISDIKNSLGKILHFPGSKYTGKDNHRSKHDHGHSNAVHPGNKMNIQRLETRHDR